MANGETVFTVIAHAADPTLTNVSQIDSGRVTVLPPMTGDGKLVGEDLAEWALTQGPLRADLDGETMLGSADDVPTWILGPCPVVCAMHRAVLGIAQGRGAAPVYPAIVGDGYKPYAAKHLNPTSLRLGDRLILPRLLVASVGGSVLQSITLGAHETTA